MKKRDKFSELHNEYYPLCFSVVYSKTGNREDTYDICQELFIKFYNKLDEINNYKKWLYGAMRLTILEYYRAKGDESVDIGDLNDVGLNFVNGFRESRIIIAEAFDSINHFDKVNDRTLFELIGVHNYSYSEAAKHMGLTKRKVEYRYTKMVEMIIDHLKDSGISDIEDLL